MTGELKRRLSDSKAPETGDVRQERQGHRFALTLASVAMVLVLLVTSRASAQSGQEPFARSQWMQQSADPQFQAGSVRLNFVSATWADVLREVAQETGSTLVIDDAPRGRFSRLDRHKYSRTDAIRILNRELEPLGYRLKEQGQFLVVLNLRSLRTEYGRPAVPVPQDLPTTAAPPQSPPKGQMWQRETVTIASRDEPAAVHAAGPKRTGAALQAAGHDASGPPDATPVLVHVPVERRPAADVARVIYMTYKADARLIEEGPEGLPAFTVSRPQNGTDPSEPDYAVGIDTRNQELVVAALEPRARQIETLIRTLDAAPVRNGQTLELVRSSGDVRRIAANLRAMTDNLLAQRAVQVVPEQRGQPGEQPPPEQPGQERPEQPEQERVPPGGIPLRLDLQGPVQIQEVPGVGLVITGNREDVEAVTQIIRALELAGAGVTPDIHLLKLRHVNSASLAALLTQVYTAVSTMRSPALTAANLQAATSIQVLPVAMPNAILIIAPARDMESVLRLAEELDQPLDPEAEFEVFRLQHAIAAQVVTAIDTFYEADAEAGTRIPLAPRARAIADVRTNSVIVQARARDMEEVARLIRRMDRGTSGAVSRMRIFPLQNAIATQLAQIISEALQSVIRPPTVVGATGQLTGQVAPGGEIPQQLRDAKSAILEFLATDGNTERLIRSGILADIRVTPDPARNALIVSAPEQSMDLMAALIAHLDQPTPLVAEVKVFTLVNSDANAAAELLRTLFGLAGAQAGQAGFPGAAGQAATQLAVQIAGAEGAGAGLIPLRFSVDPRTNTIIAMGPAEALDIVEAILLRLDESDIRQRQSAVIKLKNSFAPDVALALNQFLTAQRQLAQIDPELVTNVELLEREVIVVAEPISNSILVSATPRYYEEIIEIINQLDRKPPEVMIQAMIVEVELNNTDEFGVELGVQDEVLFERSVVGAAGEFIPGFNFNNQPFGNRPINPADLGAQALTDLGLSRVNDEFGFGGLVLAAGSESVSILIRALSAKRTVHVLSRPQIRTLDNQIAVMQVGQLVPIVTDVAIAGLAGATPVTTPTQVGIILSVVPRISPDGTIVMETIATRSSVSAQGVPIFVNSETGSVIEAPIINQTQAQAVVSVPNGQTVVLGGMISKSDDAFERRIPWLGDIPLLGYAFRYDGVRTRRTELLIFLTPRIIRHEADSELIKRVEAERMHFIEQDAEDVHGPLYSTPPPDWMQERLPGLIPLPPGPLSCPPLFDDSNVPTTVMPPVDYGVVPIPGGQIESQEILPERVSPVPVPGVPPPAPPAEFPPAGAE